MRGDVVRCYALPNKRKTFRHATVIDVRGPMALVRYDVWKETWVRADQCEVVKRLRFIWTNQLVKAEINNERKVDADD